MVYRRDHGMPIRQGFALGRSDVDIFPVSFGICLDIVVS
jgi:hypothetical protein